MKAELDSMDWTGLLVRNSGLNEISTVTMTYYYFCLEDGLPQQLAGDECDVV